MSNAIQARLSFMNFSEAQRRILAGMSAQIQSMIGSALDRFYVKVRETPETAKFFDSEAQMSGAKAAQGRHWSRIASGKFDGEFHESVRRIGSVHARIGLEPRWYIGAYALVLEELLHGVARSHTPYRRASRLFRGPSQAEVSIAILKAALLDMELSVSIYFEEAQVDRDRAVEALEAALTCLAEGDLTSVVSNLPQSFGRIESSYNLAQEKLRDLIGSVTDSAATISTGSGEIAQAAEDLARRTESNAASLEETAASVTQMNGRLKASAEAASRTVERADQAIATVGGGRAVADEAVQAMGRVSESAKGIDSVIEGLDKIAFQTRVLAMNAAVEAGRAGDAGRGFAVVADLVSALAMRAEEEAKRARDQLTVTQTDIVTAVEAVQKVDGALSNISGDVGQVHELLATMAADNQAQSAAITQISAAIGMMDQATQQNAAMVEETSAAARNLAGEVSGLTEQASRFVVGASGSARAAAKPAPRKVAASYSSPVKPLPAAAIPALVRSNDDWNAF